MWGILVLYVFSTHVTQLDLSVGGKFYLVVTNNWQLGSYEKEPQRASCIHTVFLQLAQYWELYSKFPHGSVALR